MNLNLNLGQFLHSLCNMKRALIGILAILSLGASPIRAQIENQNPALPEIRKNSEMRFEKVYLHLDRHITPLAMIFGLKHTWLMRSQMNYMIPVTILT